MSTAAAVSPQPVGHVAGPPQPEVAAGAVVHEQPVVLVLAADAAFHGVDVGVAVAVGVADGHPVAVQQRPARDDRPERVVGALQAHLEPVDGEVHDVEVAVAVEVGERRGRGLHPRQVHPFTHVAEPARQPPEQEEPIPAADEQVLAPVLVVVGHVGARVADLARHAEPHLLEPLASHVDVGAVGGPPVVLAGHVVADEQVGILVVVQVHERREAPAAPHDPRPRTPRPRRSTRSAAPGSTARSISSRCPSARPWRRTRRRARRGSRRRSCSRDGRAARGSSRRRSPRSRSRSRPAPRAGS